VRCSSSVTSRLEMPPRPSLWLDKTSVPSSGDAWTVKADNRRQKFVVRRKHVTFPLSGKGGYVSKNWRNPEDLKATTLSKGAQAPPRWRDFTDYGKLRFILSIIKDRGGKRLHLNVSKDVESELRRDGICRLRRRLSTILRRSLGYVPAFALAIDTDQGRLHVHGAIEVSDNTEPMIKDALRRAAGYWKGPVGNRRQLVLNDLTKPDWCANYMCRHHRAMTEIDGPLVTSTNNVRRDAEEFWRKTRRDWY
jgi:hypothetical protein